MAKKKKRVKQKNKPGLKAHRKTVKKVKEKKRMKKSDTILRKAKAPKATELTAAEAGEATSDPQLPLPVEKGFDSVVARSEFSIEGVAPNE